jgi:putative ABC transport system ATP-binding protein
MRWRDLQAPPTKSATPGPAKPSPTTSPTPTRTRPSSVPASRPGPSAVGAPSTPSRPGGKSDPRATAKPIVQVKGLGKTYPSGDGELEVLRGVDVTIRKGEWITVMGPSGSGKSTLLHLVGLLDQPTAGTLRVLEQDTAEWGSRKRALARRSTVGFVFQSFNLMPRLSALQNVMLPMAIAGVGRKERDHRARLLLHAVGLGDRMDHRPAKLSGGQKQRVAIARALAMNPPLLLCDEPTGNLDTKTGGEILDLFAQLNGEGKTLIVVTHDPEVARRSQRVLHIRDGQIELEEIPTGPGSGSAVSRPATGTTPARPLGGANTVSSLSRGPQANPASNPRPKPESNPGPSRRIGGP